jgi:acyl-CoA synthetase (AMP-forming)/AMP-acid ligase II
VLGFDEIRANLDAIVDAADVPAARRRGEPHCVSWLPLFHDMGLIGTLLAPWWAGIPAVLLGTSSFGRNPGRWLDRLAEPGAITAAPSFAYRAAAARATAATFEGWHAGFCGAERIENETLREVAKLPGLEGGRTPLIPSYGLAEATLLVTSGRAGSPPTVASFERDALASGRARRTAPGASVITLVGSGAAVGAHRVGIFDPDGGGPREERAVGEIRVSGPSVARGYLRDDAATATTFRRDGEGRRWLRTGDLGFLEGHELFVVGRLKEIVVVRGANHHPQDLEATARDWAPHVTGAVAFPLGENDGDFAVVCEAGESVDSGAIEQSIRSGLIEEHGIAPAFVRVVRAGAIPRTSSGKPRRLRCRELWPAETSAARIAG